MALIVVAILGGVAIWLTSRAHHGTGHPTQAAPSKHLVAVQLCQDCAHGYNPKGSPISEHPEAGLAIDNQLDTFWSTQTYYSASLNKPGVGIYLDATPGVVARVLRVNTSTPGFTAAVWARHDLPPPTTWPAPGWTRLSPSVVVTRKTDIHLSTATTQYRYYLLWITSLGGRRQLQLNELTLYR